MGRGFLDWRLAVWASLNVHQKCPLALTQKLKTENAQKKMTGSGNGNRK